MGGGPRAGVAPQTGQESTDEILRAYAANLPSILQATGAQTPGLAGQELAAAQGTTGGYNQLALDQMKQYGAPLKAMDDSINPEYAAVRNKAATQTGNLLDSINLEGLSGGERAEVERSLNQSNYATGNLGIDNGTTAVSNAMNFGDRLGQKRAELGSAISTATSFAGTKPNSPLNIGAPGNNNQALGFGQGVLGNLTSTNAAQNQLLSDYNWKNSRGFALSDAGKNASSVCCFIFLEAYNGILPWFVRVERDYYYRKDQRLANGYKKMANWLVPMMQRYSFIRHLVNITMVKPLTAVGGYDHCCNRWGKWLTPVKHFWFMTWRHI